MQNSEMELYDGYSNALNAVYTDFYMGDDGCPYFEQCRNKMEPVAIRFDYAARIGKDYGSQPRVMILGQESKTSHSVLAEPEYSLEKAGNEHYRKTLFTLALILKGEEPDNYSKDALKRYEPLLRNYCLTNYYKCTFSGDKDKCSGLKHSKAMKNHCYKLLLKEIDVLNPDLLIVQGKFTSKEFWCALDNRYGKGERVWGNKSEKADTVSLYRHARKANPLYIIYSYHPSAIGCWSRTKDDLKTAIIKFRELFGIQ